MMVKKTVNSIITTLLMIVLLLTLFLSVSSKMSGGAPRILGCEILEVLSGSMEPGIQTGSVIAIRPGIDPARLQVGDIVTYRTADDPRILITHRVKKITTSPSGRLFITEGDANDAPDSKPVAADHIVGKYVNITVPYVGYFIHFEQSKAGIVTLLIIPGVLLAVWQIVGLFRAIFRLEDKPRKMDDISTSEQTEQV